MNELLSRVKKAKSDNAELNRLIIDYMPFIRSEVARTPVFQMEFSDRLSIAMLIFMNCVRHYDEDTGGFLPFAATCIRNRLIDEGRKQAKHNERIIPLDTVESNGLENREYEKEQERLSLMEEIDSLSIALMEFNITLDSLSKICPKHNRSRSQCVKLAHEIIEDSILREVFFRTRRVPQTELAKRFNISEKTLEKHRRYIVAIAIILSGDYPGIQAFLPTGGGRK